MLFIPPRRTDRTGPLSTGVDITWDSIFYNPNSIKIPKITVGIPAGFQNITVRRPTEFQKTIVVFQLGFYRNSRILELLCEISPFVFCSTKQLKQTMHLWYTNMIFCRGFRSGGGIFF